MPYAFLSYQTADKSVAGQIKSVLAKVRIEAFLAHEDIDVSEEWRLKILEEIGRADMFVCLLSENYVKSHWCIQESGIAAFRSKMTIVPLSLDGTMPTGLVSSFQAIRVDPADITIRDLLPAFLKHDFGVGIDLIIDMIGSSRGYRTAETNFQLILPHIAKMSDPQVQALLERSADNEQVHHASLCARDYLPPLLKSHGHTLKPKTRSYLKQVCARYALGG